ncbi:MAG: helix-turn-helix domain-containing protein [Xanthomonadaceae bacterium]|nr:helix-turn-helix domain-containing protein [Xanthomonadaceae bacterium]
MDIASQVGPALRALRGEIGISQEALADRAGLDRTYVSGIERGRRNPSVRSLQKVSDALGVTLDVIFIRARELAEGKGSRKRC